MQNPAKYLPINLKALRDASGLSLSKAARVTGVSKAMLGQIERGESSPTIATLWKIATGFNTSLASLVERKPSEGERKATLLTDANLIRKPIANDGMVVAAHQIYDPERGFDFLEITFPDGYERLSEPHTAGVTEYIVVLEGEMELQTEGKWHTLKKGQMLRFHGDKCHTYRNRSGAPAVTHCLIHYPND